MRTLLALGALALGLAMAPLALAQDAAPATQPAATTPAPAGLDTLDNKVSYIIGLETGRSLEPFRSQSKVEIDLDIFMRGVRDSLAGKQDLTNEQIGAALQELQAQAMAEQKKAGDANKSQGDEFLAKNKTAEGVKTLPSGLQYKVIKSGDGKVSPGPEDSASVNYRGSLIDGTEFDSSEKHGGPAKFTVGGVIPGWTEALQLMKVGDKWQLFIPPALAYGERGQGPIPPNSVLIFDVELVDIKSPEAAPAPAQ